MTLSRLNDRAVWRCEDRFAKAHGFIKPAGIDVYPPMRADSNQRRQRLRRNAKWCLIVDDLLEPLVIIRMAIRVLPEGIQQDVHVGQNHRPSRRSVSPLESLRSIPGLVPPFAREIGSVTFGRRAGL